MRFKLSSLPAALALAWSTASWAAPAHVWVPQATGVGEAYAPVAFDSKATDGAALAEEAFKRLQSQLAEAQGITAKFNGTTAELTIDAAKAGEAAVSDRALGAVYHTLKGAGIQTVKLGELTLSEAAFSRGAFTPVYPLTAALSAKVIGLVDLGSEKVAAEVFYKRLESNDRDIQNAVKKLLESGTPEVRLKLTESIEALKSKEQEALLIERLADADLRVRKAAFAKISKSKSPAVTKGLQELVDRETDNGLRLEAVRQLIASGKKEYERYLLLDKLNAADASAVVDAAKQLATTKDKKFMPALAGLASHGNPQVRAQAIELLTNNGEFALLAPLLGNEQLAVDVREKAALSLAKGGDAAQRAQGLSWLVAFGSAPEAVKAADSIREQKILGAGAGLNKGVGRSEAEVRKAAATALGALGDTAGLEALAHALRDSKDAAERELFANQAAEIIRVQSLDAAIKVAESSDATVRELGIRALAGFSKDKPNPKINEVLRKALKDSQLGTRQAAAFALARVPDDSVLGDLTRLVDDSDAEIRAQVAHAIGRSKGSAADSQLIKLLDDREGSVRQAALVGVQTKKLASAKDKVKALTGNRTPEVRREAMRALVVIAQPKDASLFDIYTKGMQDEDAGVKMAALDGLKPFADVRAAQYVGLPLLDERTGAEVKLKVLDTLATFAPNDAVEHVVRGLFDGDPAVKLKTLEVIEALKSDKALRPLQEFINGERDDSLKARAKAVQQSL